MKTELCLPGVQIPLEDFDKVKPQDPHLKKLESLPPISNLGNRRVISPVVEENQLIGYIVNDFSDRIYRGMKYFTTDEVDKL